MLVQARASIGLNQTCDQDWLSCPDEVGFTFVRHIIRLDAGTEFDHENVTAKTRATNLSLGRDVL